MSNTKKTPMTKDRAAKIQSKTARDNGGKVPKSSFASRAQRAAAGGGKKSSK